MKGFSQRQFNLRVLETLERRVKQFRGREELWPLRVPSQPILLDDVVAEALGEDARRFDANVLRTRTLLQLEWDPQTRWGVWMIALPSKTKVYVDSDGHETRLLASGGRNEGDENDRVFLQVLAETAGSAFGIEFSGGAPSRVRSSLFDRAFLLDFFVTLFEVADDEESVRAAISRSASTDFQQDVAEWLQQSLITDH
jgi:hypothetical protein